MIFPFTMRGYNITSRIDVFDSQTQTFGFSNLTRPLMDFRMAGYGRRAAASPGVSFPAGNYTAYNEIQVYEDNSWINSLNNNSNKDLLVFPNPTNKNINISVNKFNGDIQTELFDLIGNKLQTSNETTISLRDLSKGVYILKISFGNQVKEVKVIKD